MVVVRAEELRMPKALGYDGEYDRLITDGYGGGLVEWQPGDSTRYVLVVKTLADMEARLLGAPIGARMVSVGPGGERWSTMIVGEGLVYEGYVKEKIGEGMNDYNLTVYTALINMVVGDKEYGEELAEKVLSR